MLAEERRFNKVRARVLSREESGRRLFRNLLQTGLIRPRHEDSWRIILAAPPDGPRAS